MATPQTLPPLAKPTSDDVATLLRARTKDLNGAELGVFTANTRPTDAEVARIIDLAYAEVTGRVGVALGARCADMASSLIVVRAAAWVELSYWPEQVRSDRSVYAELIDQWTTGLPGLIECAEGNVPADGGDTNAGFRFGVLDVHGWTASPYYGAPDIGAAGVITGAVGPPGPQGPPGAAGATGPAGPTLFRQTIEYSYNTQVVAPPGGGQMRTNVVDNTQATKLWLSTTDAATDDKTHYLDPNARPTTPVPESIYVQDKDDATKWARFVVSGMRMVGTPATYAEYDVTWAEGGVALPAQRVVVTLTGTG